MRRGGRRRRWLHHHLQRFWQQHEHGPQLWAALPLVLSHSRWPHLAAVRSHPPTSRPAATLTSAAALTPVPGAPSATSRYRFAPCVSPPPCPTALLPVPPPPLPLASLCNAMPRCLSQRNCLYASDADAAWTPLLALRAAHRAGSNGKLRFRPRPCIFDSTCCNITVGRDSRATPRRATACHCKSLSFLAAQSAPGA